MDKEVQISNSYIDRWIYSAGDFWPYGEQTTYEKGMAFLDGYGTIEDWGCGPGWASNFVKKSIYIGVDGTKTNKVSVQADLNTYKSNVDCIFMRHVLEHNLEWKKVLQNALDSFQKRMSLIIFTPFTDQQTQTRWDPCIHVPDLCFNKKELTDMFPCKWFEEHLSTETQYKEETIFYLEK